MSDRRRPRRGPSFQAFFSILPNRVRRLATPRLKQSVAAPELSLQRPLAHTEQFGETIDCRLRALSRHYPLCPYSTWASVEHRYPRLTVTHLLSQRHLMPSCRVGRQDQNRLDNPTVSRKRQKERLRSPPTLTMMGLRKP